MFNTTSKTYRFFDINKKMMFQTPEGWENPKNIGEADACHRTSMSYISYGDKILKEGILSCFTKVEKPNGKYYYQGARCYPRYGENDMSRDQTIMALASLKFNGDEKELKEIGRHLRFRLSKRFLMGPTLWVWIRMATSKSKWWTNLFGIFELIEFVPGILWNKLLYKMLGYKDRDSLWYMDVDPNTGLWHNWDGKGWVYDEKSDANNGYKLYAITEKAKSESWFRKFLSSTDYPTYALHLTSWLVYFMEDCMLKKWLTGLIKWSVEKENLLLKLLSGQEVQDSQIDIYKPMKSNRWSDRFNGTCYQEYLKNDDSIYNVIDKDMLIKIKNK
jgi:hypothetical protein